MRMLQFWFGARKPKLRAIIADMVDSYSDILLSMARDLRCADIGIVLEQPADALAGPQLRAMRRMTFCDHDSCSRR